MVEAGMDALSCRSMENQFHGDQRQTDGHELSNGRLDRSVGNGFGIAKIFFTVARICKKKKKGKTYDDMKKNKSHH